MIKLGDKVWFYPFREFKVKNLDGDEYNFADENGKDFVTQEGTVTEVHEDHNWFGVEYTVDGNVQHICFHFTDVGESVFKCE